MIITDDGTFELFHQDYSAAKTNLKKYPPQPRQKRMVKGSYLVKEPYTRRAGSCTRVSSRQRPCLSLMRFSNFTGEKER